MGYVRHAKRQELIRGTADDLAISLVHEEEATIQFTLNDADAGLLEDAGETLLAGAKRLLSPNPVRGLDGRNEHAAHACRSFFVRYRAVADGKAGVFPIRNAAALDLNEKIFSEEGAACSVQNRLVQGPQLKLDFRPYLMEGKP